MVAVQGSEHWVDEKGAVILNESTVSDREVMVAMVQQHPEVAALVQWSNNVQRRNNSIFERDRYVTPNGIFKQFRVAQEAAASDDVVSGVMETTESLAFATADFEADDLDEENVWNQWAADIDLDSRLREMWRELFTVSQFYAVVWWGRKSYKVKGKSAKGVARKKAFNNLRVPLGLSLLDPLKVVPVGNFLFNQEKLAYIADRSEADSFNNVLQSGVVSDPFISQVIVGPYTPNDSERKWLVDQDIEPDYLFLLNPQYVFRHTETRPQYERFASVRMKSVFELLDLKQQLRQMDRAHLLGGTNFIILVRKGSDQIPAKGEEVAALAQQVRVSARIPVIVGDHRLQVDIITPKTDHTLQPDRYNGLDARISARLFQIFMTGNFAAGAKGDDSIKLAKVIARGLESRRKMLKRALEQAIIRPTVKANNQFTDEPRLMFHPRHVALDFDAAYGSLLQDIRDRGDLSRESMLDEIGFSQEEEAAKRQREKDKFDDIFQTQVPFSAPTSANPNQRQPLDPKAAGRKGGKQGGLNPNSSQPNSNPV